MLKKGFDHPLIMDLQGVDEAFVLDVEKQLAKEPGVTKLLQAGRLGQKAIAKKLGVSIHLVEAVKMEQGKKKG